MGCEKFEKRSLSGNVKVACKYDDGTVRIWEDTKQLIIQRIRFVVDRFMKQGYVLTLRQLHYQLVTRNWIVNHDTAYKKLGTILDDCRYAGLVDWKAIEDRGRVPYLPYWINNPDEALQDCINQYRINRQLGQAKYLELWTEKDALSGILRRTTSKYHIQLVVNKGYTSSSAAYNAYTRIANEILAGRKAVILYFGDHDPSGLDMVRDIRERLVTFLSRGKKLSGSGAFENRVAEWWDELEYTYYDMNHYGYLSDRFTNALIAGEEENELYYSANDEFDFGKIAWFLDDLDLFEIQHIGLTMQQIKTYNLPPNPTKLTDTRADKYIKQFGKTCWEVDALEPNVLTEIVESHIIENIDVELYDEMIIQEKQDIEYLKNLLNKKD